MRRPPQRAGWGEPASAAAAAADASPSAKDRADSAAGTFVRRHFEPLMLSAQVLIDLAVVLLALFCGWWLREEIQWKSETSLVQYREVFLLTGAVCLVCFHGFNLYSPLKSLLNIEEFKGILKATVMSFLVVWSLLSLLDETQMHPSGDIYGPLVRLHQWIAFDADMISRFALFLGFGLILAFMTVSRFVSFKAIQALHRLGIGNRNVLVYGTNQTAQSLQRKFLLVPTLGLNLVGMLGDNKDDVGRLIGRSRVLGEFDDLERVIAENKVSEVFIALPEAEEERMMGIIERLEELGVLYHVVPRFYHLMAHKVRINNLDSIPLISLADRSTRVVTAFAKRTLDVVVSLLILTLGAPLFLIPAILIKRESPGPVFFLQTRIGKDGQPFRIIKFRTMHQHLSGDAPAPTAKDDPRITRIGRFLRRYSLDELPQVLNVLRGEMSLVGPRPEMPFLVAEYGPIERERLRAKPGVTGLWQISYARGEAIHANIDYDVYYIENQSLLLDLVILALTSFAVVKGTGAY